MGVLTNVKQYVGRKVVSAAKKTGDAIATVSALSPKQIEDLKKKQDKYLDAMPDMTNEESEKFVQKNIGAIGIEIYQAYLEQLHALYLPVPSSESDFDIESRIRYFDITKWVIDTEEKSIDKLINVYHVLSEEFCNIALIYNRTCSGVNVTLGVVNTDELQSDPAIAENYYERLSSAIRGNFPGSEISDIDRDNGHGIGTPSFLEAAISTESVKSVSVISNVASEKSEDFISQSMEKLLDGVIPQNPNEEYTIILLAKPIKEQLERKNRLFDFYTDLAPYSSWQTNYTYTENDSTGSSANLGVQLGVNIGNQAGNQSSEANSESIANTEGTSDTEGSSKKKFLRRKTENQSHSTNNSTTKTLGKTITQGITNTVNLGANFGVDFSRSSSVNVTIGKNEGITQNFTNFSIKHTLDIIEKQLERTEQSTSLGMWDYAAYVISDSPVIANNVAYMYLSLVQGENSYLSQSAVNLWDGDIETDSARTIISDLQKLRHPAFCLKPYLDEEWLMYPLMVDATTSLSGKELAESLNFPRKSICGLPVLKCAPFGRNVSTYDAQKHSSSLKLGHVFHMYHDENNSSVELSKQSLASHTFITGSTGSGKSNTVYKIIDEARNNGAKFLVIEPAKGEYKDVFQTEDVSVYGTNKSITPLLRINPFSFPKKIHILEHLDRLIEIFNVCWPMYAAMPAVLKAAVEKSYEDCGWNLVESTNEFGDNLYPNFADVSRNVKDIIDSSEYDSENKGAYKGSLLTRLQSLTNGINGLIFTPYEIEDSKLFDENVIVDISRVGSSETKSLIMGVLILKLQEYRISTKSSLNSELKHITILEEAHNILKRSSPDMSSESGNLTGKSVEMISNAIAEMRTYGEGFIIADQAPGLLDMAAIRNTNTKIIMRLPDLSDRELVGKAANLNDDQIAELARLPVGVGAVYQNEWIEPVLCKIDRYDYDPHLYEMPECKKTLLEKPNYLISFKIAEYLSKGDCLNSLQLREVKDNMELIYLPAYIQVKILKMLSEPHGCSKVTNLAPAMTALFPSVVKAEIEAVSKTKDKSRWTEAAHLAIIELTNASIEKQVVLDIITCTMTDYLYNTLKDEQTLNEWKYNLTQTGGGLKW